MNREAVLAYVAQEDARGAKFRTLFGTDWVTVYESLKTDTQDIAVSSALVPKEAVERALGKADWDLLYGHGLPGFSTSVRPDREDVTTYERFGNGSGIEPIIVHRSFRGARPPVRELCEEFRFFHNLHFEADRNVFIQFADNGDEEIVVRMSPERIAVRRRELMEYITAKGMVLALCLSRFRYGTIDPVLQEGETIVEDVAEPDMTYAFHRSDARRIGEEGRNVFSWLLGKVLIHGGQQWEFSPDPREQHYPDFIIGVDEDGNDVLHSCDPDLLANFFGASPDAPHYLTPVFFTREVLRKYFADPSRYEVSDCFLSCLHFWGLRMDNDHERYVIVWLGDLGNELPERERPYWKSFNVRPDGRMSDTYFRRAIHADFAEATAEDHVFKDEYPRVTERWTKRFGWPLYRPLAQGDQHLLSVLRVPLSNTALEFDEQALILTKLMVDYLNERELARGVSSVPANAKGIDKLQAFLHAGKAEGIGDIIGFLRGLQSLRSTGAAHAKGENYERAKIRFGVGSASCADVFRRMLSEAISVLRALEAVASANQ